MEKLEALLRLLHLPNFGSVKIRKLINTYSSPENAFNADPLEFVNDRIWKKRWTFDHWKYDLDLAKKRGIHLIDYLSPQYPRLLLDIPNPPILLYVKGNLSALKEGVAIIGTRQATSYGLKMADHFSQVLAKANISIISGLALGIDTAAHEGALKKGTTVAVLGSGLENVYPPQNKWIFEKICDSGAVISEFPMTTSPDRHTFPQRNRITTGISRQVLLVEAPKVSGAMSAMSLAIAQKKLCWAVPGRIDAPTFEGNNYLIHKGLAKLAYSPENLLDASSDLFYHQGISLPSNCC